MLGMLYFINEVIFFFVCVYIRMAFKDLHVNYAKSQTCLAVTAMKVSVTKFTICRTCALFQACCAVFHSNMSGDSFFNLTFLAGGQLFSLI